MKCVQLPRHRRLDCMMLYRTNVYISFPKFPPTEPVAENRHCRSTHTALTREKNEAIPYNCCCVDALSCCGFHALGERNSFVRNFIDRGAKSRVRRGKVYARSMATQSCRPHRHDDNSTKEEAKPPTTRRLAAGISDRRSLLLQQQPGTAQRKEGEHTAAAAPLLWNVERQHTPTYLLLLNKPVNRGRVPVGTTRVPFRQPRAA